MAVTLAEIMELDVVRAGAPEVLSAHGLERAVRWVHSSGNEDLSHLLPGGELVLTTGPALSSAPERYLRGLADAGAVGVMVELLEDPQMPAEEVLPAGFVALARRLGLTLVVLRRQVRFVEITEQVHRRLVAEQYDEVKFARRIYETFTELAMHRTSPQGIVLTTAELLDAPVVLEDLMHRVVALAEAGRELSGLLGRWSEESRRVDQERESTWSTVDVGDPQNPWGKLIAVEPQMRRARVEMVLERAAQSMHLQRMQDHRGADLHQQAHRDLFQEVLEGRVGPLQAEARATAMGLDRGPGYLAAVARLPEPGPAGRGQAAESRRTRARRLHDTLSSTIRSQGHTGLLSTADDNSVHMVLALRPRPGRSMQQEMQVLGREMRRHVEQTSAAPGLVVGLGEPAEDLVEAILATPHAGQAALAGLALPASAEVCRSFTDLRFRGLATLLRDDPRVQRFAEAELGPLVLDDIRRGGRSMEVLRAHLRLAGNKSAVAQALHMSRPALYTHLERIQEILGVSLEDGESRSSLHAALMIHDAAEAARDARWSGVPGT
ncbi:PucR family transcriptional regulator [Nesterenkonia sp. HG001]|uniref:PucR family transcriptional regulator n=1 Tax=Nesterenkonia sp. HG001 TaxID=2983207 RepID=UPI002AC51D72|nr:PucR family transcriptional regulator [Nesterenkonia sp. HG001]MDZ5076588.1 PucR family transcriptional regulator [Nesterenkonia sp. HG001]